MAEIEKSDAPDEGAKQSRISPARQARMKAGFWIVVMLTITGTVVGGYVMGYSAAALKAEPQETETEYVTTTATATITLDPRVTVKPTQMSVTDEVAPLLWRGTATVATGHSSALFGVRTVWAQTVDGAVGAAMNYLTAPHRLEWFVDSSGIELQERLFSTAWNTRRPPAGAQEAEMRADARRALMLDDNGNALDYDGKLDPYYRVYGGGEPRYGAYQVLEVTKNPQGVPVAVRVAVVMPVWTGLGSETNKSQVYKDFIKTQCVMTFGEGDAGPKDWRLDECEFDKSLRGMGPKTNPGYQSLRDAVGPGWAVPADSTEEALPGVPFAA